MEVIKDENKTIIDLTNDEQFNKYIEDLEKRSKRDSGSMKVVWCIYIILVALLLLLKFCK